ncbi:MAG: hypothetical protein UR43_C0019G0008 [candidate division TM6 bacterium GW2011_GWF2_33_332]|nr:MAG: hypothetical protein UR43_C0019G0008 [candidate division TM6 bacterium GW2011_GWF2_33_332]
MKAKSAKEYWKERFGEDPKSDSDKFAVGMMQDYASECQQKSLSDEEIENGITVLATLHAKQSVGDWATGYITGAKWARDKQKGGKP